MSLIHYQVNDIRLTMLQTGNMEWSAVGHISQVCLDDVEQKRCKLLNKDIKKFLEVKRYLINGYSPTEINKLTGIARQTVYNYRDLLSKTSLEILRSGQAKDSLETGKQRSVFFILLVISEIGSQSTVLNFLFVVGLVALPLCYFWWKDYQLAQWQNKMASARPPKTIFLKAFNLTHRKEVIIVATEKEAASYKRLLRAYKNRGRHIELIKRNLGEDEASYFNRKEQFTYQYNANNGAIVKAAKLKYYQALNQLYQSGKLDYLRGKLEDLESKAFIEEFTQALESEDV